ETLRYGENPHQPAARYRRPGSTLADGPFATDEGPLQGKALSYNNVLDASAAAAIGRTLRGRACVIVKHTNPCGAAERDSLRAPDPPGGIRTAGGAALVGAPDTTADDPTSWRVATTRGPTDDERRDLDLAWRLVRGVASNAIVLVRDGRLVGFGSGQTSRVDA